MAGIKNSKNNPDARGSASKSKMVLSSDCEKCTSKCLKGIKYLETFKIKKQGIGVCCKK